MSLAEIDAIAAGPWAQSARLVFGFLFLAVGALALAWAGSNIRAVPPETRAAVLRLGTLDRVQGSGLVLAWPKPFEEIVLLPSSERGLELRVTRLDAPMPEKEKTVQAFPVSRDPRANIAFFLTGDAGVVHLSADVFYRVTDPAAYLLARDGLDQLLQHIVIASAVAIAAGRPLDGILVTGPAETGSTSREALRADLAREANRRLAALGARGGGVEIDRVDLRANLPSVAKAAFDQVLTASQTADAAIAEARTDAETLRQTTEQDSDAILSGARATAEETLSAARSKTAEISALATAPSAASVLDRAYSERIGAILSKARRVDAVDQAGAARVILPGANP